jgi:Leucine-rich repeat (LRR) protein
MKIIAYSKTPLQQISSDDQPVDYFSSLPVELLVSIFSFLAQENAKKIFTYRQICQLSKQAIDEGILKNVLCKISRILQPLPHISACIAQEQNQKTSPIAIFQKLSSALQKWPSAEIKPNPLHLFTLEEYEKQLKDELDLSLIQLWKRILSFYPLGNNPPYISPEDEINELAKSADKIRLWLNDPANAPHLQQIKEFKTTDISLQNGEQIISTLYNYHILPPEIGLLTGLETLDLTWNELKTLPESIGNLVNLKTLILNNNRGIQLPSCLSKLKALEKLELAECSLTTVPPVIFELSSLRELNFSSPFTNRFSSSSNSAFSKLIGNRNLNYLSFHQSSGITIPSEIRNLNMLTTLNLENCLLEELPDAMKELVQLKNLIIGGNQLRSLPEWIGDFQELSLLDLKNNQLKAIPDSLTKLSNLHTLNLANNRLQSLPKNLGSLPALTELYLDNNRITLLPDQSSSLHNLTKLTIHANPLITLPQGMANLPKLESFTTAQTACIFNPTAVFPPADFKFVFSDPCAFEVQRFKACLNHSCQTPLARLCQSILRNADENTLRKNLSELSPPLKQEIYSQAKFKMTTFNPLSRETPDEIENALANLCQDRPLLNSILQAIVQKKLHELRKEEKEDLFYKQIYKIDGVFSACWRLLSGNSPSKWGRDHAHDNIIGTIDAIALVTKTSPNR